MKILQQINNWDQIVLIEHNSDAYSEAVKLRYEILRKPLGLNFAEEQLQAEKGNYHLVYLSDDVLVAYLMLVPQEEGKMKMKQVAVDKNLQRKGIGRELVLAAEKFSFEKGFSLMYCHARDTAVPFYKKLNYTITGEMFIEVSIPHFCMEKRLV
ncbi:MAG: GNAT family N-acetyltransferase [Chitinophagales bacterium]